jgi:hypothetical protein
MSIFVSALKRSNGVAVAAFVIGAPPKGSGHCRFAGTACTSLRAAARFQRRHQKAVQDVDVAGRGDVSYLPIGHPSIAQRRQRLAVRALERHIERHMRVDSALPAPASARNRLDEP